MQRKAFRLINSFELAFYTEPLATVAGIAASLSFISYCWHDYTSQVFASSPTRHRACQRNPVPVHQFRLQIIISTTDLRTVGVFIFLPDSRRNKLPPQTYLSHSNIQ